MKSKRASAAPVVSAASARPLTVVLADTEHDLFRLIGYCDAVQALTDAAGDDGRVFDYLTPWGLRMLFEPIVANLTTIRQRLEQVASPG